MAMADYDLSDLAAVVKGNGGNGMFANGDGLLWLLFILVLGWGNGGLNRGGNGGGVAGGNELYPWMNLQQGFTEILQALCSGLAGVTGAITAGFANAETAATNRAMGQMQQGFGMQTAITQGINGLSTAMMQGFNGMQSQFADCCCENRLGLANLSATVLSENCADRQALSDGVRDILANQTAGVQRVLDKLCDLELAESQRELAAERRENDQLRQQLSTANLAASQIAQTSQIVDQIYNRLATCPVGTQPVYGNQPIFTCQRNGGCCGQAA